MPWRTFCKTILKDVGVELVGTLYFILCLATNLATWFASPEIQAELPTCKNTYKQQAIGILFSSRGLPESAWSANRWTSCARALTFWQRLGHAHEAADAYDRAIGLAEDPAVKGFLLQRRG
jgi:hypothetical protein